MDIIIDFIIGLLISKDPIIGYKYNVILPIIY